MAPLPAQRPGLVAGFGARNRLFEVGWLKFPSLMTAVWAAQHVEYMRQLQTRLSGEWALLRIPGAGCLWGPATRSKRWGFAR